jgi:hypothetical protein
MVFLAVLTLFYGLPENDHKGPTLSFDFTPRISWSGHGLTTGDSKGLYNSTAELLGLP